MRPPSPVTDRLLLTYKQAGELLQVTDRTVYQIVRECRLPAVRFGRTVRIDRRDLEQFIQQSKGTDSGQGVNP